MTRHNPISALLLALVLAAPVAAQPTPAGPEFPLDDVQQERYAFTTVSAVAPNGSFVGVWSTLSGDIRARGFSSTGEPLAPASEIRPISSESRPSSGTNLRAAALAGGGSVAVWENEALIVIDGAIVAPLDIESSNSLSFRILNALGQPAGPEVLVAEKSLGAAVAPHPSGGFLLVWSEPGAGTFVQRFDALGQPIGGKLDLPLQVQPYDLAVLPDGAFAPIWGDGSVQQKLSLQVFEADGDPRSAVVQVHGTDLLSHGFPRLATDGTGRLLATWSSRANGELTTQRARFFSSAGAPVGAEIAIDPERRGYGNGDVSLRTDGSFLASWQTGNFDVLARAFDADGTPQGPAFLVHTGPETQHRPSVETTPGGWLVAWTKGIIQGAPYVRQFQLPVSSCTGLCLNGNRFRAEVSWRVPATGAEGTGTAIPLTGDTGAFWFFSPANYELVVKVLDGRGINGHFWVFYGSLTDVEFDLTVTDTVTGEQRTYHNPHGTMASRADTVAF
jgi:hypothetical protein